MRERKKQCRICDRQFESNRELQEHRRGTHSPQESAESSGYGESHGADANDIRKTA